MLISFDNLNDYFFHDRSRSWLRSPGEISLIGEPLFEEIEQLQLVDLKFQEMSRTGDARIVCSQQVLTGQGRCFVGHVINCGG
jgi:hypothetical protein